ncbi:MAG: trypsin-like peptidase domain-containing protein [Thermoanaerobaculia bacterium]
MKLSRRPRVPRILVATGLVLACVATAGAGPLRLAGERAGEAFDRKALRRERVQLAERLASERVAGAELRPLRLGVTAAELAGLQRDEPRYKVGIVVATGLPVDLGGPAPAFGASEATATGWRWTGVVESAGAVALRLHFTDVDLSQGATLAVYSDRGQAFEYLGRGPGGRGDFWSHTIFGPRAIVQLADSGADPAGVRGPAQLTLAELGHLSERFTLGVLESAPEGEQFCSFNEDCVINAACENLPPDVEYAADAVAQILFASGGFLYICSGGLMADSAGSGIPYFLTANHCLWRAREASTVEAFFQFTTPCSGACYDPDPPVPSTLGSAIRATNRSGDFTLLQLDEAAPGGSAFLGWSTTPVALTNGTPLYRISHPSGAPQAYSEHQVDTTKVTCGSWPRGDWIYSADLLGATEGGSSGSPVLNGSGEVVGQLSGACGFDVDDPCDSASNATVDGAFADYFDEVEAFLGDGGGCLPPGAACTSNSECCSDRCRHRPGGLRTCD